LTVRVVLVDDQALLRQGFRMILEAEGDIEVVAEAEDGAQAVELVARCSPDVFVMDVRMPRMDGIEATRRIVSASRTARVLVLTTFDLDEYALGALRAGASGFILKDVRPAELVSAVRTVASGDAVVSPRATRRLLEEYGRLAAGRGPVSSRALEDIERLSDREREVLAAMARGLSNGQIAEELYVSEATVKSHVGRILAKLGVRDRVQAVVLAFDAGFVRPASSPGWVGGGDPPVCTG
jgi:DNA-binding NarL/FixJ family response regulator